MKKQIVSIILVLALIMSCCSISMAASLGNAQFSVKWYDGYYTEAECKTKTPDKEWVFKTDDSGQIIVDQGHKVSGPSLLQTADGVYVMPLGTVMIQQLTNPDGAAVTDGAIEVRQIRADSNTSLYVTNFDAPVFNSVGDIEDYNSGIEVDLVDKDKQQGEPQGWAGDFDGFIYDIINKGTNVNINGTSYATGDIVGQITFNKGGHGKKGLPAGSYALRMNKAASGYTLDKTEAPVTVTNDNYTEKSIDVNIGLIGLVINTDPNVDITLKLDKNSPHSVYYKGTKYDPGDTVFSGKVTEGGSITSLNEEGNRLPFAKYDLIAEHPTPGRYLDNSSVVDLTKFGVVEKDNPPSETLQLTFNNPSANIVLNVQDAGLQEYKSQGGANIKDLSFDVRWKAKESGDTLDWNGNTYNDGDDIATGLKADSSGKIKVSDSDNMVPGDYQISMIAAGGYRTQIIDVALINEVANITVNADVVKNGITVKATAGSIITVTSQNENPVIADGVKYTKGQSILTLTMPESGTFNTVNDLLPVGEYNVSIMNIPDGYALIGNSSVDFSIPGTPPGNRLILAKQFLTQEIDGSITVSVYDEGLARGVAEGSATLAGFEFDIKNSSGTSMGKITTDVNGVGTLANNKLPDGTYTVMMTKVGTGYILPAEGVEQQVEVTGAKNVDATASVKRGGVKVTAKAGVEITITNMNANPVLVNGAEAAAGEACYTEVVDSSGVMEVPATYLPYGHYKLEVTRTPDTLTVTGDTVREFDITEDGKIVTVPEITLDGAKGVITVKKIDADRTSGGAQGDADIRNAQFSITGVGGSSTVTTGGDGSGRSTALTKGSYVVKETTAPEGYTLNTQEVNANLNATTLTVNVPDSIIRTTLNIPVTKGVKVQVINKSINPVVFDGTEYAVGAVIGEFTSGDGDMITIANVPYGTYNYVVTEVPADVILSVGAGNRVVVHSTSPVTAPEISGSVLSPSIKVTSTEVQALNGNTTAKVPIKYTDLVPGKNYAVKLTLKDANGETLVSEDGSVITAEQEFIPTAYDGTVTVNLVVDGNLVSDKVMTVSAKLVETSTPDNIVASDETGKITYIKIVGDSEPAIWLANKIETEVAADKGTYTVNIPINYKNLKAGQGYMLKARLMDNENKEVYQDGYGLENQAMFTPGSPDGTQTVKIQLNTDGLSGKEYWVQYWLVAPDGTEYTHIGEDEEAGKVVKFGSGSPVITADANSLELDANTGEQDVALPVEITNMTPGEKYTVKGYVIDPETGSVLLQNETPVEYSQELTPDSSDTQYSVIHLMMNTDGLGGKEYNVMYSVVAPNGTEYEAPSGAIKLYIIENDASPVIRTEMSGPTNVEANSGVQEVRYQVGYGGLTAGEQYTISATLYDLETQQVFTGDNGGNISYTTEINPTKPRGNELLTFQVDTNNMEGKTLVVVATLSNEDGILSEMRTFDDNRTYIVFNDNGGEVDIPSLVVTKGGIKEPLTRPEGETTTVTDVIYFQGLDTNTEYTIKGTLVDKSNGEPLVIGGTPMSTFVKFTPSASQGYVELSYEFDTTGMEGKSYVAIENLLVGDEVIFANENLNDAARTVTIVSSGHVPVKDVTGKIVSGGVEEGKGKLLMQKNTTLVDKVQYGEVVPGQVYNMRVELKYANGQNVTNSKGEPIVGSVTFTPEALSGLVDVPVNVDPFDSELGGKKVVFYEYLTHNGEVIDSHEIGSDLERTTEFEPIIISNKIQNVEKVDGITIITSLVSYQGLQPGSKYFVTVQLQDSEGNLVTLDGANAELLVEFIPENSDGSQETEFKFDATKLSNGEYTLVYHISSEDMDLSTSTVPLTVSSNGDTLIRDPNGSGNSGNSGTGSNGSSSNGGSNGNGKVTGGKSSSGGSVKTFDNEKALLASNMMLIAIGGLVVALVFILKRRKNYR